MKVCFLISQLNVGGISKVVRDVSSFLSQSGHDVFLLSIYPTEKNNSYLTFLEKSNVKVFSLERKGKFDFMFIKRLRRIMKEFCFDVVSAHPSATPYLFFVRKGRTKLFHTIHTEPKYEFKFLQFIIFKIMVKFKKINLIACSRSVSLLAEKLYRKKVFVAQNGVELKPLQKQEQKRCFDFIFVGRLVKGKGIEKAILVFKKLSQVNPNLKFCICGYGNELENLKKLIHSIGVSDKVNIVDNCNDPTLLYASSRFYFSLSEREGGPTSVLEAMTQGCVPIVSNIRGFRNYITNNVNGFVVDGDTLEISNQILDILKNDKMVEQIKQNMLNTIHEFDIIKTCQTYEAIFNTNE